MVGRIPEVRRSRGDSDRQSSGSSPVATRSDDGSSRQTDAAGLEAESKDDGVGKGSQSGAAQEGGEAVGSAWIQTGPAAVLRRARRGDGRPARRWKRRRWHSRTAIVRRRRKRRQRRGRTGATWERPPGGGLLRPGDCGGEPGSGAHGDGVGDGRRAASNAGGRRDGGRTCELNGARGRA